MLLTTSWAQQRRAVIGKPSCKEGKSDSAHFLPPSLLPQISLPPSFSLQLLPVIIPDRPDEVYERARKHTLFAQSLPCT